MVEVEGHHAGNLQDLLHAGMYIDVLLCDFVIEFSTGCYSLPWVVVLGVV